MSTARFNEPPDQDRTAGFSRRIISSAPPVQQEGPGSAACRAKWIKIDGTLESIAIGNGRKLFMSRG